MSFFDSSKFHDNLIHGIFICVEDWKSELRLDLDHILQWPTSPGANGKFLVASVLLVFHDVTDLAIKIEWGNSAYQAAVSGPFIEAIERLPIVTSLRLPEYFQWKIKMSDGHSSISFGASAASLGPIGSPQLVERQYLTELERHPI